MCNIEDFTPFLKECWIQYTLIFFFIYYLDNVLEGKRSRFRGRDVKNKFDSPGVSGESKATPKKKAYSPSL